MKFFSQYYYQIDRSKWIFIISFVFITRMSMQHRNPTPFAHVRDISRLITYLEFAVLQPLHIVAFEISRPFSLRDNWDFSQSLFSSVTIDFAWKFSRIFETSKYFCPARVLFKDDPFKLNSGKKKKKKAMRLDDAPHTRNLHVHPRFMRTTTRDNETINMQRTGPGQWRSCTITISLWQRTYPRTSGIRIRNNVNDRCQRTGRSIPLSFLSSQFHPFSFSSTII